MQLEYDLVVPQEFIDYRNNFESKIKKDNRTKEERLIAADCLLLEWHLIETGLAEKPEGINYDVNLPEYNRTEIKRTKGKSVTLTPFTIRAEFDNYIFFKFVTPHVRPFKVGDNVSMEIVQIEAKDTVEQRRRNSYYNDENSKKSYYVYVNEGKIAKPNFSMYNSQEPVYSNPLFT
jgi:hypothetical protein